MRKALDILLRKLNRELKDTRQGYPFEDILNGVFTFGRHTVRWLFKPDYIEVEIYNSVKDTFLDRVSFYLEDHAIGWDEIEVEETNEWDYNGFANCVDYYKLRL